MTQRREAGTNTLRNCGDILVSHALLSSAHQSTLIREKHLKTKFRFRYNLAIEEAEVNTCCRRQCRSINDCHCHIAQSGDDEWRKNT